jgi:hypothetical protein
LSNVQTLQETPKFSWAGIFSSAGPRKYRSYFRRSRGRRKWGVFSSVTAAPVWARAAARPRRRRAGPAAPRRPARPSPRRHPHARRPRHPVRPSPRRRPARGALHRVVTASLRRAVAHTPTAEARRTVAGHPALLAPHARHREGLPAASSPASPRPHFRHQASIIAEAPRPLIYISHLVVL